MAVTIVAICTHVAYKIIISLPFISNCSVQFNCIPFQILFEGKTDHPLTQFSEAFHILHTPVIAGANAETSFRFVYISTT